MARAKLVPPGTRYGLWTVLGEGEWRVGKNGRRDRKLKCRCDCGTTRDLQLASLRGGTSKSCGCVVFEALSVALTKHGLSKDRHPAYLAFLSMKQRCLNKNHHAYESYGGRGISICPEWVAPDGAERFVEWSLANGYRKGLTIDRIDNDKGYSPDNCRWVTHRQNSNNRRNTIYIEHDGKTMSRSECWHKYARGVKYQTFCDRISRGIPVDAALKVYSCRYLKLG